VSASILFFAESQVGVGSVGQTLKRVAHRSADPRFDWVDITYRREDGREEVLPLPRHVSGIARGFLQVSAGLSRGRADVLVFLTHNPAVLHPMAIRRRPTVLWTDVTPLQLDEQADRYDLPREGGWLLPRLKRAAVQTTFRAAALCLGWSEWARRSLVESYGVPESQTGVLPPGIDLEVWRAPARTVRDAARLPRLLFVGGDFRRKGGRMLLDVFRHSLRGRCELDLVTREAVDEEPGVRVHRRLEPGSEPLLELYRAADLFVLPTLADCHSIASLEAMAMGLPVVLTRVGAAGEIVLQGQTGYLLPTEDGAELRRALESLLGDPARAAAMGARGLARVRERFDARRTLEGLSAAADSVRP
jgi:glycosyltransferase involved in cell wall biosynthesis